ncbi:deacetylvindoline O-acetyltransferase-like [Cynara cardunculus var. scolymus]|uniref:deacetylvindoline O-acetyltransferase-like n=1 Tax=Cynara cardunculus var. scolymus TaxID=59895 RepID=UPI000D629742|nr:deacetylvindoline O-acetyltransferase-like [Cynara cardunculus var. scolymus]
MAKRAVKMEIISKEIIKPSSPTPNHLKTFRLSLLDQLTLHSYTPILLLYESETSISSDVFKKSLSETLKSYYPFAGRLREDGVTVDCDDQGVVFVEAKFLGCTLSDFLLYPKFETQRLLFPEGFLWKGSCIDQSFLAAQVTSFEGGGMAVTISVSHKVADGSTIAAFLDAWAATARGEVKPKPMILATSIPSLDLTFKVPEIVMDKTTTCITKRYVFDAQKIVELKNSIMGLSEIPTRVELVTAELYKCAIATSMAKAGYIRNSTWIQLVNMRSRMTTPLPENSAGNFSWYFTASNDRSQTSGVSNLVMELKKGIKELCGGGDNLDLSNWLMDVKEFTSSVKKLFDDLDVYRCSSLCKQPFYQIDFGCGRPQWVTMADVFVRNTFILFDTPDGDGIEAMVSLEEEDMRLFSKVMNIDLLA